MQDTVFVTGRVDHYNAARGFGFIEVLPGASAPDRTLIFFHISHVTGGIRLHENDLVSFRIVAGKPGKLQATEISLVQATADKAVNS